MTTRDEAIDRGEGRLQFYLTVDLEGEAFRAGEGRAELANILDDVIGAIRGGNDSGQYLDIRDGASIRLWDSNGNYCGKARVG